MKNYSWFNGKICKICGRQAEIFRLINNRHYLLCNSSDCDFEVKRREGWIDLDRVFN